MAFCEDAAASGGYWLACSADEIYASSASIIRVNWRGVFWFWFPELLAKIGVEAARLAQLAPPNDALIRFSAEKQSDVAHLKSLQKICMNNLNIM